MKSKILLALLLIACGCQKKPEAVQQPIPQKVVVNEFINEFQDVDYVDVYLHFKDGSFVSGFDAEISSQGVIHVPKNIHHKRICN